MDKDKVAVGSIAALLGALLPALLSLNIFATKADLESSRADFAEKYVRKEELRGVQEDIKEIKEDIKQLLKRSVD